MVSSSTPSAILVAIASAALAQNSPPPDVRQLTGDPAVKSALEAAKRNEPRFIEEQIRICEFPAPPFHEDLRGKELERMFQQAGLENVRIDKIGNVIGVRPGASPHPNFVLAAHLDTVFPEGTDVHVTRQQPGKGSGALLKGPGIGDDCRGLAVLLSVIHALNEANVKTPGTITFVADVGEEGLGGRRGTKNLFDESLRGQIDKFVSIDGTGLTITNVGVGSYRYRATFKGPGGHSFGAFGMANPIQAMGRAIAKIDSFEVPSTPKTTFNVGRVGGGTSVNAIPFECWMEVDMRSADKDSLEAVNAKYKAAAVTQAVEEENRRWNNRGPVSVSNELVGLRPARQHSPRVADRDHGRFAVSKLFRRGEGQAQRKFHRFERSHESRNSGHHHRWRRNGHGRAWVQRNLRHHGFVAGNPARAVARHRPRALTNVGDPGSPSPWRGPNKRTGR